MKLFFLLVILSLSLNASKILSYNIYDRTDRSDVMITFDTPYENIIKQSTTSSKIIISLSDVSIESPKMKKTNSSLLHSINIIPMENQTQIIAHVGQNIKLHISRTSDAYGLRLRFTKKKVTQKDTAIQNKSLETYTTSSLPTKKGDDLSSSYYIVVTILIVGIFILFILKKKITNTNTSQDPKKQAWLFQENKQTKQNTELTSDDNNQVSIRFQKILNEENSVVMLDFGTQSYLVLMGKSNIILDKFNGDKPTTQEDFNTILQSRNEELENFLEENKHQKSMQNTDTTEALQAYKERAATMLYDA